MTIAAGFLCSDGIVLASDTLYSGHNKRYGRKIWVVQERSTTVAIAGAGGSVVMRRVRDEMTSRLSATPADSRRAVIDCVDGVLYQLKHKYKPKADEFPLSLLVAVRDAQGCVLYESNGAAVLAQTDRLGVCIGWGTSLGLYFMDSLYTVQMPIRWARIVAAHLVKHCKTYVDSCGGDTHILEMPTANEVVFVEDRTIIAELENYLAGVDGAYRLVFPGGGASDETLEFRLTTLNNTIRNLSHNLFVAISSERVRQNDPWMDVTAGGPNLALTSTPTSGTPTNPEEKPTRPRPKRGRKVRPPSQG